MTYAVSELPEAMKRVLLDQVIMTDSGQFDLYWADRCLRHKFAVQMTSDIQCSQLLKMTIELANTCGAHARKTVG